MKQVTTMKLLNAVVKIAFLYVLALAVYVQPSCKDPDEYKPDRDSLIPAPAPPQPLSPEYGYVFMIESVPFYFFIRLAWTDIDQANTYLIEYKIDTFPHTVEQSDSNFFDAMIDDHRFGVHYWRVRASSPYWEWLTDYSEQWQFEIRWRPQGPQHLSPPNYSTVYIDSLYSEAELQWDILEDEEFYEFRVFKDTVLYDQNIVSTNNCRIFIDDTTSYNWQVRAGSPKWQYYSYWSQLWYFHVRINN